jgi:hypothetical protein
MVPGSWLGMIGVKVGPTEEPQNLTSRKKTNESPPSLFSKGFQCIHGFFRRVAFPARGKKRSVGVLECCTLRAGTWRKRVASSQTLCVSASQREAPNFVGRGMVKAVDRREFRLGAGSGRFTEARYILWASLNLWELKSGGWGPKIWYWEGTDSPLPRHHSPDRD